MNRAALLLAVTLSAWLAGCESPPPRETADRTTAEPGLEEQVVDVAVLPPRIEAPDAPWLERIFRAALRRGLIASKRYSVPSDEHVADALAGRDLEPGAAAAAAGSDAALLLVLDQWDKEELLPKGRIHAGGEALLVSPEKVLWRRTFRDLMVISRAATVTASNRPEAEEAMIRDFVAELLATLPAKR
jgi:hypothetical protein